jgi:hypothetical protein
MGSEPKQDPNDPSHNEKEFYELLTSPGIKVQSLIFPNEEVALVIMEMHRGKPVTGKERERSG